MAGYTYTGTYNNIALLRHTADGTLDTSFNTNGKVIKQIGSRNDIATDLKIDVTGKIVLSGASQCGSWPNNYYTSLLRYTSDGTIDTSFGDNGYVISNIAGSFYNNRANSLIIQNDGKYVISGYIEWYVSGVTCYYTSRFFQ